MAYKPCFKPPHIIQEIIYHASQIQELVISGVKVILVIHSILPALLCLFYYPATLYISQHSHDVLVRSTLKVPDYYIKFKG